MMSDFRAYLATLGLSSPMALEGFLEAAPDAIVVVDWSGNIAIVNQFAERLFGYSRQELLGTQIEGLVPQRFSEHHAGTATNIFASPTPVPMQFDMLERFVWVVLSHRALLLSRLRPVTAPLFCTTLSPSVAWSRRSATVESRPICQSAASDGATAIAGPHGPGHRPRADSACMVRVPHRTHGVRWQVLTGVTA